jgi:hypothetical protein
MLVAALGFVLGSLSSASAKEFIQFECGGPQQENQLSQLGPIDASDPNVITALYGVPVHIPTCATALKILFGLGYKLIGPVPRPVTSFGGAAGSEFTQEGGIVYLLEK